MNAVWRLILGETFAMDLDGVKILFYDPTRGRGRALSYTSVYGAAKFLRRPLYEHSVVTHLKQIVKQCESITFLDVGAHYGYYTAYMSKLGGPSSKIHSFEPNSDYYNILSANVKLNGLQNVVLHRVALSDKKGIATLEMSEMYKSLGLFLERRKMRTLGPMNSLSYSENSIDAVPFDELAQAEGISPNIVKIDVHGAEGNVINGMKKNLERCVFHLYCELHGEMCDGYTARDILNMLQDAGMETFEFRGFWTRHGRLARISDDLFSKPQGRMIYARK